MKALTGRELVELLEEHGWLMVRIKGSHHIMKKEGVRATLSVPVHRGKNLKKGLHRYFLKTAGIETQSGSLGKRQDD